MHIKIRFLELAFVFLIYISLSAGLELSTSIGGNQGSSSMTNRYGATIGDFADQHICLNPNPGTLSNEFSGTGSLQFGKLSIHDEKGNYAYVYRSVDGATGDGGTGTTYWKYDWGTYYSYSPSLGSGVGAWLKMTATNAYLITCGGYSSNSIGNTASASMSVGSTSSYLDSDLVDYYVNPTSSQGEARVYQSAGSAKSSGQIEISGYSNNTQGDFASSSVSMTNGAVAGTAMSAYAQKTNVYTNFLASSIAAKGECKLYGYAFNAEGDASKLSLIVSNGKITNPSLESLSAINLAQTKGSVSGAYGKTAEINGQGLDNALGYQGYWSWNAEKNIWEKTSGMVKRGAGYFAAVRRDDADFGRVSVSVLSAQSDVNILTSGFGKKTALILDPFCWEYENEHGSNGIRDTAMSYMKERGYAVTYYSDSAVSKDKVKKMDEYWISAIHSYTTPTTMYLSKSSDGSNGDTITASELKKAYTYNNGMAFIIGSGAFSNTGSGTWADAISRANVRGGTASSWEIPYSRNFINKYFTALSYYFSASRANSYASSTSGRGLLLFGKTGNSIA